MASLREELFKQAERYKEILEWMEKVATAAVSRDLTSEERKQLCSAYKDAMEARIAYRGIISSIKAKGENDVHVSMIGDFPTEIDPGRSNITTLLLKILDRREIPYAPSIIDKVKRLRRKADCYCYLAEVKTGPEREKAVENALSTFEAAQATANRNLAPCNPIRLELAVKFSDFYYKILKSPDGACSIAKQAVDKAMPELEAIDEFRRKMAALDKAEGVLDTPKQWKKSPAALHMRVLRRNITLWTSMMQDDGVTDQGQNKKRRRMMSNQGKKEKKKQEDNGAESSVNRTPSNQRTAADHDIIEEAAPKKRNLTVGFGSGFQNRSNSSSLSLFVTMASQRNQLVKQAERYKEMVALMEKIATAADSGLLTNEERSHIKFAHMNAMNARIASRHIISFIKKQEANNNHVSMIPTEIDPGCSDIITVLLKVLDLREIPYAASGLAKVECLRRKALYCKKLAKVKTGAEREEALKNVLSIFKAAQDIAHADLAPSHPDRLGLAVEFSVFYYNSLNSPDDACNIAKQALDEARAESPGLEVELAALPIRRLDTPIEEYDKYRVAGKMGELRRYIALWTSRMQGDDQGQMKKMKKRSRRTMMSMRGKKEKKKQEEDDEMMEGNLSHLFSRLRVQQEFLQNSPLTDSPTAAVTT